MSSSSGGLPVSWDRYRHVWQLDFEFRTDDRHHPVPVAMYARERRSGRTIQLRRSELLASTRAPFDTGSDSLVTSYGNVAELSCFAVLRGPAPHNILCTYFETSAAVNGLPIVGLETKRPSLLEACELFGIPHMGAEHKQRMRDLILNNIEYTPEQWREIDAYVREDVSLEVPLLEHLAPQIDLPTALFRGRYAKPVTEMELTGLPVNTNYLNVLVERWQALRMYYIRRDDHLQLYDDEGSFCLDRFAALIAARGWNWPRTSTGKPDLKSGTIGKQAKHHPELRPLQKLRDQIAELRLGAFLNTVGADGASRIPLMPFWTRTGRNQPSGRDKAFLLSLPSWTHGLIQPRPDWGVASLDWSAQEIGVGAGLSGDTAYINDFLSGDPHIRFAVRAGLAPADATKASHRELRDSIKPISLGVNYGITRYGAAAQTGKSLLWAADMLRQHPLAYPVFAKWQENVVTQALFDQRITSPLGWPMAVHAETRKRALLNYMQQAGGADVMRVAAIAAREAGIVLCAPVHDAFWITAPLSELDDAIATMSEIMVRAGAAVCGVNIPVEVSARVHWPNCLGDVRAPDAKGQAMWTEIRDLVTGDALRRAGGAT